MSSNWQAATFTVNPGDNPIVAKLKRRFNDLLPRAGFGVTYRWLAMQHLGINETQQFKDLLGDSMGLAVQAVFDYAAQSSSATWKSTGLDDDYVVPFVEVRRNVVVTGTPTFNKRGQYAGLKDTTSWTLID